MSIDVVKRTCFKSDSLHSSSSVEQEQDTETHNEVGEQMSIQVSIGSKDEETEEVDENLATSEEPMKEEEIVEDESNDATLAEKEEVVEETPVEDLSQGEIDPHDSKSPSSDSGVVDVAGTSKSSNQQTDTTQNSPKEADEVYVSEDHDSESSTVMEQNNNPILQVVPEENHTIQEDFAGNGELPNTPLSSESETSSHLRRRFVHSYLDNLEKRNDQDGKVPYSKCPKGAYRASQFSSLSSDDDGDTSSEYTTRLLNAFESRRRRRHRPRPRNIDTEDSRPSGFRPPSLSNFDSFLASLSRYTGVDDANSTVEYDESSQENNRNGVRVEVFSGTQGHDIKVKSDNQVRLFVEVTSSSSKSE